MYDVRFFSLGNEYATICVKFILYSNNNNYCYSKYNLMRIIFK